MEGVVDLDSAEGLAARRAGLAATRAVAAGWADSAPFGVRAGKQS